MDYQQHQQQVVISKQPQSAITQPASLSSAPFILQVPQNDQQQQQQQHPQQKQLKQIRSSSSSNSTSSSSAATGSSPTPISSANMNVSPSKSSSLLSSDGQQQQNKRQDQHKISFHLKTSIFTRRITIDADKMALGLIKQLAIAFLNEIYFDQNNYPPDTYIGDYIRKQHLMNQDNLKAFYERLVLRKYLPEQDTFVPFNSVSDINQESYICIEISERQAPASQQQHHHHQYHYHTSFTTSNTSTGAMLSSLSPHVSLANNSISSLSGSCASPSNLPGSPSTPSSYQVKIAHDFHSESYFLPTYCASCSLLIKGLHKQGFQCYNCKRNFCPKCKQNAETTSEICYNSSSSNFNTNQALSPSIQNNAPLTPTIINHGIDPEGSDGGSLGTSLNDSQTCNVDKLDPTSAAVNHSNMSKRKSASNILHSFIANPFKSHHSTSQHQASQQQQQQQHQQQQQQPIEKSTSKSMRGSAGALGPVLQQLSRQMRSQASEQPAKSNNHQQSPQQQQQQQQKHSNITIITNNNNTNKDKSDKQVAQQVEMSSSRLLNVQTAQLSSSHQNLFTMNESLDKDNASGCSSAHQSPSKGNNIHQLSNSARTSARDLLHAASPTRRDQASYHSFVDLELAKLNGNEPTCDVCNKSLKTLARQQSQQQHQQQQAQLVALCKTCQLQVHAHCKDLALADCLSRITESSRAAAERNDSQGHQNESAADGRRAGLKSTNSNVSRDNIRLHRLATKYHVKKPDSTKPIIEGWLQHKTTSDEQSRKHYWRLDEKDITLYENDTSTRYFKAIALNKITRVISASSLPKLTKEDVALSSPTHQNVDQKAKSANASPKRNQEELRAQMNAMFAFEVATGSIYLVQANDETEANRWKGSLEAMTTKRAIEQSAEKEPSNERLAAANNKHKATDLSQEVASAGQQSQQAEVKQSAEGAVKLEPEKALIGQESPTSQQQRPPTSGPLKEQQQAADAAAAAVATNQQMTEKQQHRQHHHTRGHHHHHHHFAPSSYRNQHKTYTDPNRSRLCNKPRIEIILDPMSVPDHWIEGKYLIERDRQKGVGFEELGSGQFGKVYAAISEIKAVDAMRGIWSGIPVAIKEISKARFDLRQQAKLKNEANILSRLDHPGIIILERVHDLPDKLYIVMEQLEDDMLEMIVSTEEKRLNERVTKFLTYQILKALEYLHGENIAHCDLKPENVLLVERRSQFPQIKLCDFGFAKIIEGTSFRSSLVGTPAYLAPEVVKGEKYNRSVDLWSVGVIVYVSLSGEFPFNEGENIHDQISRANFMYPDQPWAKISSKAKDFINRLLRVNSDKRLSARQALMDEWIQQDYQLWCDLCELEMRVGCRWVSDDTDHKRWTTYALRHNLQIPRSAIQLHQQWTLQEQPMDD